MSFLVHIDGHVIVNGVFGTYTEAVTYVDKLVRYTIKKSSKIPAYSGIVDNVKRAYIERVFEEESK